MVLNKATNFCIFSHIHSNRGTHDFSSVAGNPMRSRFLLSKCTRLRLISEWNAQYSLQTTGEVYAFPTMPLFFQWRVIITAKSAYWISLR